VDPAQRTLPEIQPRCDEETDPDEADVPRARQWKEEGHGRGEQHVGGQEHQASTHLPQQKEPHHEEQHGATPYDRHAVRTLQDPPDQGVGVPKVKFVRLRHRHEGFQRGLGDDVPLPVGPDVQPEAQVQLAVTGRGDLEGGWQADESSDHQVHQRAAPSPGADRSCQAWYAQNDRANRRPNRCVFARRKTST